MIKKIPLWIIIVVMVLQIAVPVSMIAYEEIKQYKIDNMAVSDSSEEFKFKVKVKYVKDNRLYFDVIAFVCRESPYGDIVTTSDGYSGIYPIDKVPDDKIYILNKKNDDRHFYYGTYSFPVESYKLGINCASYNFSQLNGDLYYDDYYSSSYEDYYNYIDSYYYDSYNYGANEFGRLPDTSDFLPAYITMIVYDGAYKITGLYIEDMTADEWLSQNNV